MASPRDKSVRRTAICTSSGVARRPSSPRRRPSERAGGRGRVGTRALGLRCRRGAVADGRCVTLADGVSHGGVAAASLPPRRTSLRCACDCSRRRAKREARDSAGGDGALGSREKAGPTEEGDLIDVGKGSGLDLSFSLGAAETGSSAFNAASERSQLESSGARASVASRHGVATAEALEAMGLRVHRTRIATMATRIRGIASHGAIACEACNQL